MNQITLIGQVALPPVYHCTNLGQDLVRIELRTKTPTGHTAHHCTAWGPAAIDLHTHLSRGDRILIRGELHYRSRRSARRSMHRIAEVYIQDYSYLGREALLELTYPTLQKMSGTPG